jgi:hypothetical protein
VDSLHCKKPDKAKRNQSLFRFVLLFFFQFVCQKLVEGGREPGENRNKK